MDFSRPQGPFMVHYECFGLEKGLAWVKSVHIFPIHVVFASRMGANVGMRALT